MKIEIGKGSSLHMGVFIYGRNLHIGENSCINRNVHIDCRDEIRIERNVSISPECTLITGSHDIRLSDFRYTSSPIYISEYVWMGTRAMILPGVHLGKGVVVCAGSVVTKSIPDFKIVAGVPAKIVGERSSNLNYSNKWMPLFD